MATPQNTAEAQEKSPKAVEALHSINRQEHQEFQEGMRVVQEAADSTQKEVVDLMKKKSEKIGETGERKYIGTGKGTKSDDDKDQSTIATQIKKVIFPPQGKMVSKVVTAIRTEIKEEMKRAAHLEKKLATGGAKEYNESIARIRSLKSVLQSALNATMDFLKDLYVRYVVDGKRDQQEVKQTG